MTHRIAITPGEPAGIGPDLCIQIAQQPPADAELVLVADPDLIAARAKILKLPLTLNAFNPDLPARASEPGELTIQAVRLGNEVTPGKLDVANGEYVLQTLRTAVDLVRRGDLDALVTGPVQKSVINDAGYPFIGHTEFLAEHCQQDLTVMMLATQGLRVALATTHLPLTRVPGAITRELLGDIITILYRDLQDKFAIAEPRVLVCGLNPHAGEGGHLGREEIDIIDPVIKAFTAKGMHLTGPLPADTLFTERYLDHADAVLAMYHDQGLPVLKFKGFGRASNITLGLPIIRTSVDHGTALDLAGTGRADTGSFYHAIATAIEMAGNWKQP